MAKFVRLRGTAEFWQAVESLATSAERSPSAIKANWLLLARANVPVFDDKYRDLANDLERAKEEVRAEKSPEEDKDGSFFNSVPRAAQREQQGGRSVFSDVDE